MLSFGSLWAQIDNRFNVYSWEQYGEVGMVNSISEDYSYFYFATDNAGIIRINKFSQQFSRPITTAQGLKSNIVEHVYFDEHTGILWSVGSDYLEYSFSREGSWNKVDYNLLSLKNGNQIFDIGSSKDYLWLRSSSKFLKLDHVNGVLLGVYASPDELDIEWGDISLNEMKWNVFDFNDYFVEGAWLLSANGVSDNQGNFSKYLSYYESNTGINWMTLSNGYILKIDEFNKLITPLFYGLASSVPISMVVDKDLWISGIGRKQSNGITIFDVEENSFENILSTDYLSFKENNIYSSSIIEDEIWFGSEGYVLVYNRKKDSFRTLGFEKGVPRGKITHMEYNNDSVFVGSINGITAVNKLSKKHEESPIEDFIFSRNFLVNDIEKFENKIFFVLNNKVFNYKNDEKTISALNWSEDAFSKSMKKSTIDIASRSVSRIFSRDDNLFIVTSIGVIDFNNKELAIPSSVYFDYKITDIALTENSLFFISTVRGLFIFDFINKELINYYDFPFLRNIFQMNYVSEYLLLLTSKGLIKFNFNL